MKSFRCRFSLDKWTQPPVVSCVGGYINICKPNIPEPQRRENNVYIANLLSKTMQVNETM